MVREAYLKTEVAIPDFLAALKEANPDDAEYIDTKLKEYNNGELRAPAVRCAARTRFSRRSRAPVPPD